MRLLPLVLILGVAACSGEVSELGPQGDAGRVTTAADAGDPVTVMAPAAAGYQLVAGSRQGALTHSGAHLVDVTVGAITGTLKTTTAKGHHVFLSVQGQVISK
jgi:hypothetical protein